MGEFADDMIDQMLGLDDRGFNARERMLYGYISKSRVGGTHFQRGVGNYMWRMADGTVVSMHDMTEEHLANSAALARRKGNTGKADQLEEVLRGRYNNVGYPSA